MRFSNEVTIARPPQELFAALTDMERVAPCLPGASIEGRQGDDYLGRMSVRVGPITAAYRGRLHFVELDQEHHRAVIKARAEELNGQGSAEAAITISVAEATEGSRIGVDTDLQIRGRLAQFGRGAMGPIVGRLLTEFATNLESLLAGAPTSRLSEPATASGEHHPDATLDVVGLIGTPALRMLRPALWLVAGFSYGYLLGRLRERQRQR